MRKGKVIVALIHCKNICPMDDKTSDPYAIIELNGIKK
jgi:hypothetical protein